VDTGPSTAAPAGVLDDSRSYADTSPAA
jgi:hypothetical protein